MRNTSPRGAWLVLPLLAACTSNPDFLFPKAIVGVPGIQDLGTITPIDPLNDEVQANVIYGELGPTGTSQLGGLTFEFIGTNGPVCVWVDPEAVFWNQSVARGARSRSFREPDNIYDDGDLDVYGGQSVFYTGTPGAEMGTFEIRYTDPLGNTVPIDFIECSTYGGRGAPEACEFKQTTLGVRYTVVLDTWATPLDDNRLGYGLLLSGSSCEDLVAGAAAGGSLGPAGADDPPNVQLPAAECLIRGEVIQPLQVPESGILQGERAANRGLPAPTWVGLAEVPSWPLSVEFENAFCQTNDETPTLANFCRDERARKAENEETCSWERDASMADSGTRCFCGDPRDTPAGGAD